MNSSSIEEVMVSPLVEASMPEASQKDKPISSPPPSDMPLPDVKAISTAESSPERSAVSAPPQTSTQLFFPLASPLAGKTGITLSKLVADLENASIVTPDIANVEMIVAGENSVFPQ
jgi:hypothetical protein